MDANGNPVAPHTITAARPYCDGSSTCGGTGATGSGTSNTLADVAMYYYENDLRTNALGNCTGALNTNVCADNVPHNTTDYANWHHMSLFTIGLGAPGYMVFDPNYQNETATSTAHDYYDVANGVASGTDGSGVVHCPWIYTGSPYQSQPSASSGAPCEWPTPNVSGIPSNIDDLWHAAVNGHGLYFSATDPSTLSSGLATALNAVNSVLANTASASTSTPNLTTSSNFVFSSVYTSGAWSGDLSELVLNPATGALETTIDSSGASVPLANWTAAGQLDAVTYTSRKIYFNKQGALAPLTWNNLTPTQQGYFNTAHITGTSGLSQMCSAGPTCLSTTAQTSAAGTKLLSFILGDRSNEGLANNKYYRVRTHVLGDIVNSSAAFVGTPPFQYSDTGYGNYVAANSSRAGVVYVGSNDGMLHAFAANTGAELWAYVPSAVMPNLYALADKNYASQHQYYVDGSPVTGDVYFGGSWHTILVCGLNDGGNAYFALDITNPATPSLLWEFTDTNLGLSFGNPVITKLANGTWVVLLSSGYNNNTNGGDGLGHLYVVNAQSGLSISGSTTVDNAGSTSSPSGLAKISAFTTSHLINNTATFAYGGDMLGNLWRFDINGGTAPQLLVQLTGPTGTVQPITTIPELGSINNSNNVIVLIGTGSYLGNSDLTNTNQQSFYGIKDTLAMVPGTALYPTNPQASGSKFVQQTLSLGTCPNPAPLSNVCTPGQSVVISGPAVNVDWNSNNGWYVNFPTSGERDNTSATLVLGTVVFNTNVPGSTACSSGGSSYEYFLNYLTGAAVSTAMTSNGNGIAGVYEGAQLSSGTTVVQSTTGVVNGVVIQSGGGTIDKNIPLNSVSGTVTRVGWHETD
jgi:type IV pilus assembly protein PilY1